MTNGPQHITGNDTTASTPPPAAETDVGAHGVRPLAPAPVAASGSVGPTFVAEARLLATVEGYLRPEDVAHVEQVLAYARELRPRIRISAGPAVKADRGSELPAHAAQQEAPDSPAPALQSRDASLAPPAPPTDVEYVIGVAQTLAEFIHIDPISLAAVLLYQAVEGGIVTLDDVRARLGASFGEEVAQTIANIERFDTLQRPGAALRRSAQVAAASPAADEELSRERRRSRMRQKRQDAENLRKMFVAMTEDPRVAVFKIADQLRLIRLAREAADFWRARDGRSTSRAESGEREREGREASAKVAKEGSSSASPRGEAGLATTARSDGEASGVRPTPLPAPEPVLSEEEARALAEETREIYAPLAGRLGMGRVEGELDDVAFAILQPDEYRWLAAAVKDYAEERGSYVARVREVLERELAAIGLRADVSGRVKHLASIYRKVQRTGSRDLSNLYDVLAFRIIVPTVEDCYLVLGQVHALWKPKDGRIKDFIANPKPNGYQSLHTTVFCLDDRLAEFQIRTPQMHEMAEYGVAMHWYYKAVGDSATADALALQAWVQQLREWQQELQGARNAERTVDLVKGDVLREQIFVFTPAGDVKELPAGATPLDFAYLIHTDVGNHVAGARVSSQDATGRLVTKLVPLDYELKNGDVVEIMKRKSAHPTRDWLAIARTKAARDRIQRYLKAHERDIDLQMGRERLDRELRGLGLRKGFEELSDEDMEWLAAALEQRDAESLLVAIGGDKLRLSVVVARLRERLLPPPDPSAEPQVPAETTPAREQAVDANVGGMAGMLTRLAACCDPLPGDELMGYITRGRGVVIHRADCPNLRHLLEQEPERAVPVTLSLAKLSDQQHFRAPIVIEALDRTGLLADVTGVITGLKINMQKVNTATNPRQRRAVITVTLEIQRPEQLNAVIKQLQQVPGVSSVGRKRTHQLDETRGRAR
ncbi:MAG TPA: TGS domain-containing protein [Ktedonobacterales bacterium]